MSQLKGGLLTVDDQQFLFKQDWVPYGIEVSDVEGKAVFAGCGIRIRKRAGTITPVWTCRIGS